MFSSVLMRKNDLIVKADFWFTIANTRHINEREVFALRRANKYKNIQFKINSGSIYVSFLHHFWYSEDKSSIVYVLCRIISHLLIMTNIQILQKHRNEIILCALKNLIDISKKNHLSMDWLNSRINVSLLNRFWTILRFVDCKSA